jgi:hypothetical protein
MPLLGSTRRPWKLPLAALLLVLQGLAGGMVAVAHATEAPAGTVHIEAPHASGCPVLHDSARCALCQFAGMRGAPANGAVRPGSIATVRRSSIVASPASIRVADHLSAPPRAPPVQL